MAWAENSAERFKEDVNRNIEKLSNKLHFVIVNVITMLSMVDICPKSQTIEEILLALVQWYSGLLPFSQATLVSQS